MVYTFSVVWESIEGWTCSSFLPTKLHLSPSFLYPFLSSLSSSSSASFYRHKQNIFKLLIYRIRWNLSTLFILLQKILQLSTLQSQLWKLFFSLLSLFNLFFITAICWKNYYCTIILFLFPLNVIMLITIIIFSKFTDINIDIQL